VLGPDRSRPRKGLYSALDEGKVNIMKKLQTVILTLVVLSALGAVFAVSASAEVTLLAEWLVSGAAIAAGVEEATTQEGEALAEGHRSSIRDLMHGDT
jgi:hypothetical protein